MCCANIQSYISFYRSYISLYIGDYFILCHHLRSCFVGRMGLRWAGLSSVSLRLTAPSAEEAFWVFASAEARRWTEPVWQLSDRPRHPFGPPTFQLGRVPTLAGRGGSVSRRDHNQAYRRRAHLSGGTTYAEATPPNASRSSGEGVWGRGASLREAASPPESPHRKSLREGARGRGLLYREASSLAYQPPPPHIPL